MRKTGIVKLPLVRLHRKSNAASVERVSQTVHNTRYLNIGNGQADGLTWVTLKCRVCCETREFPKALNIHPALGGTSITAQLLPAGQGQPGLLPN